jgi:hypothetical protein
MAGYKTWAVGEEVLAVDLNSYIQSQAVARFPNASTRTAQLPAPALNQLSMRDDRLGVIERWNGSAWVDINTIRELGYTEFTGPKTVTGTNEANATSIVTTPSFNLDGATPVLVEIFAPGGTAPAVANGTLTSYIYQNGTAGGAALSLGQAAVVQPVTGGSIVPVYGVRRVTPPAGSYTFIWGAFGTGGNGAIYAGPGTVNQMGPGFIRVTRAT